MSQITEDIARLAKKRLAEIEAEAAILRNVIAVYDGDATGAAIPQAARARPKLSSAAVESVRHRRLTPDWLDILRFVAAREDSGAHLDEIETYSNTRSYGHPRDRLRSQMHNWKVRGWVTSPVQSVFMVTEAGRAALDRENEEGADEPPAPSHGIESNEGHQDANLGLAPLLNSSTA
jgi:hypothetical protein